MNDRTVLKTLNEVKGWFASSYSIISFDTETTSLDYLTQELVGISFCSGNHTCYIDIIDNKEAKTILDFVKHLFENQFILLIAHNISYDLKVLGKYGIKPSPDCKLFCTQTAAHLLNENEPKSLAFQVKKHFYLDMKDWKEVVQHGYHSQAFYSYGMDDAYYCYKLYKIQHPLLQLNKLDALFFNIEMPFIYVKVDLEVNGFLVDKEKLQELLRELETLMYDLKLKMCRAADVEYHIQRPFPGFGYMSKTLITNVNFNSSSQLRELITKKLGLEITVTTKNGTLSVNKESLKTLKGQHPFVDLLRTYNAAETLYSTFVAKFPNFIDSDGRIRCSWHNTIAVTGRVTTSKPNLLNLPRENDEIQIPVEFRSCFVGPKGKKIVACDYSGQELCWLGVVTQDKNLISDIKNDKDLHLTVANRVFNLGIPDVCLVKTHPNYPAFKKKFKKERYIGKNGINFPVIYGKQAYGVSKDFNVSNKEAQRWIDGLFFLYPDVKKSIAACHKQIDETGEVRNYFGRIRRLNMSDKYGAYRQGFNFKIQGPSSEQIKLASTQTKELFNTYNDYWDDCWGAKIILMVYDEIVYEVDEKYAEVSSDFVRKIMEDCVKTNVPFTVDVGIGDSYAEAKM